MRDRFDTSDPDDVDQLFARLDRTPVPEYLTARVLSSTVARTSAWPWRVACLTALGMLALAGYELGVTLAASDGLEVMSAVFSDVSLLAKAPGDVLAALSEVIPWTLVGMAGLSAVLLILSVRNVQEVSR